MTSLLPTALRALLTEVADLLEVTELDVFGGAALDLLADSNAPFRDIDIAVRGTRADAERAALRLSEPHGVTKVSPVRDYWVHWHRPVAMFDVEWKGRILDVNYMDHTPQCHFDVETVIWRYPSFRLEDRHQVIGRHVTGVRLVTGPYADNPVLLLNRVIKLAAKYDLVPGGDTVARIVHAAAQWASADDFHGQQAHEAYQRALHHAVFKAPDPDEFLRRGLRHGLLDARLPLLAKLLRADSNALRVLGANKDTSNTFWTTADVLLGDTSGRWRAHHQWLADHGFHHTVLGEDRPW